MRVIDKEIIKAFDKKISRDFIDEARAIDFKQSKVFYVVKGFIDRSYTVKKFDFEGKSFSSGEEVYFENKVELEKYLQSEIEGFDGTTLIIQQVPEIFMLKDSRGNVLIAHQSVHQYFNNMIAASKNAEEVADER
jgi:hypothetical protein